MKRSILPTVILLVAGSATSLYAQQVPNTILFNGKIVTADDFFSIEEAVAIVGERITAVGTDEAIQSLAGADTETVDLGGRTGKRLNGFVGPYRREMFEPGRYPSSALITVVGFARAGILLEVKAMAVIGDEA